jgi:hypothetical protein
MLSQKQRPFYFALWNRVMVELGWYHLPAKEKDSKRRALHAQCGCPASSKAWENGDFDRYVTLCLHLLGETKSGGNGKATAEGERRRLVWRILADAQRANLDPAYIVAVSRDLNVLGNWQDLDLARLRNLRDTIHNRARKHSQPPLPLAPTAAEDDPF